MKTTEARPDLIREFLLEEYPNPERTGCPSEETLKAAAENRLSVNHSSYLHFANCSECFAEYRGYRVDWERRRSSQRHVVGWATAAGLLIALSASAIPIRHFLGLRKVPNQVATNVPLVIGKPPSPSDATSTPPLAEPIQPEQPLVQNQFGISGAALPAVLDLAQEAGSRGSEKAGKRFLTLPAAKLNLSVLLAHSSQLGPYELHLARDPAGQKIIARAAGEAVTQDGNISLNVYWPLNGIAPGEYYLFVAPQGVGEPGVYEVRIVAGTLSKTLK